MAISYAERIPNNVDLGTDRTLQRALEHWQPKFLHWWKDLGPTDFQAADVYLRTATSVDSKGWATYGAVKMPDYRWGIFLADAVPERKIGFGDFLGQPVWQQVPGEHRSTLRRLIVTQGDTEPASVEQQRLLGHTCPSLYDLRSLFQINVEEGRHLWAMVYLLHAYFGRDGREEAEQLLQRHSGYADNPRILNTFNEPIDDWLSLFMFTYFTDRDGKFQLKCLAESGFDPLSRTCRFMLTEEAYHMSVGLLGLGRVIQRTLEVMDELKTDDPEAIRRAGAIDLPTFQRYLNFWFSSSVDLFGAEMSSNAATTFANGIKGRADEDGFPDHVATEAVFRMDTADDSGRPREEDAPMRSAINEVVRHAYIRDCALGINRWNRAIEKTGREIRLSLPHHRFNRRQGVWAPYRYDLAGNLMSDEQWDKRKGGWLPSDGDKAFVKSLMHPVREPGKIAAWIAPPDKGVNGLDVNYEYVRL
jgi:benzoyl-CoA 2,3-dioxygenase component B